MNKKDSDSIALIAEAYSKINEDMMQGVMDFQKQRSPRDSKRFLDHFNDIFKSASRRSMGSGNYDEFYESALFEAVGKACISLLIAYHENYLAETDPNVPDDPEKGTIEDWVSGKGGTGGVISEIVPDMIHTLELLQDNFNKVYYPFGASKPPA